MTQITTRPVTTENFADLAALMEARGGPDFCWCMAFRDKPREDKTAPAASRKAWRKGLMQARVKAGGQVGLLAYDEDTPAGWCSTGPMSEFRRLGGPKPEEPGKVWAISCFFVPRSWRGQGLMREMVLATIDLARFSGASELRASPVAPDAPSYRFQGYVPLFQSLGFKEIAMAGNRRHIMRLPLR
ncbi:MAG: GNAT family N-acetyltransferase [Rhodobacteraceae bacterium]|nr:GNAT family N-acetyltransferase [Paracoccaceae bacterium]